MRKLLLAAIWLLAQTVLVSAAPIESFDAFIAHFEPKALAAGVTEQTYQTAMAGLTPDAKTPALIVGQPEFATPMWDYLDGRINDGRIKRGIAAIAKNQALFSAVGKRYGVDPYILGAIWGMETDYGAVLDNPALIRPVIRSLATLVYERRSRLAGDEQDLIAALLLVQRGPLTAQTLVGSWAGAIGHLQVNPSNIIAHGTDGDGDGLIDLHHSLADALATSAEFLLSLGYQPNLDWGFEVSLPAGFNYLLADRDQFKPISFFAQQGVTRVKGRPFGDTSVPVFLYVPAGQDGPKFLMTRNYLVLKGYNFSDSYAMSVAHMADRLRGGGGFAEDWPRSAKMPNLAQRKGIQQALITLGLYAGDVDGRLGPITQAAYAKFQASRGEVADGFLTKAAYDELAAATR